MVTLDGPTKEEIKNRIDKSKDNYIDPNELTDFIFDEKEGEKNLRDLGSYLNKLDFPNFDEIKLTISNYFRSSERIDNYNKKISEKLMNNDTLDKKELSLMYLKMVSDSTFTWHPLSVASNNFTFDSNEPIDKICNGTLINYIRSEYKNWGYLSANPSNKSDETKLNTGPSKEKPQSNTIRPATEKEISLIPQSVKNFFSAGCEYLVRGKDYIVKKTSGVIETVGEFVGGILRTFVDFTKIVSAPSYSERRINKKTGKKSKMTFCSKTAQQNAKNFGVSLPNGDAKEGVHKPIIDNEHFISSSTKQQNGSYIDINTSPENANFADISVESDTINGIKYGHRAIAFKNNDGQRYVLDPYYSGGYNTKPIPWEKYPKHSMAEKINFYNAPKQSKST